MDLDYEITRQRGNYCLRSYGEAEEVLIKHPERCRASLLEAILVIRNLQSYSPCVSSGSVRILPLNFKQKMS